MVILSLEAITNWVKVAAFLFSQRSDRQTDDQGWISGKTDSSVYLFVQRVCYFVRSTGWENSHCLVVCSGRARNNYRALSSRLHMPLDIATGAQDWCQIIFPNEKKIHTCRYISTCWTEESTGSRIVGMWCLSILSNNFLYCLGCRGDKTHPVCRRQQRFVLKRLLQLFCWCPTSLVLIIQTWCALNVRGQNCCRWRPTCSEKKAKTTHII